MVRNKLKVSTNPSYTDNEQKVLDFVGYYSPAGINPTSLSKITQINENTVKSILTKFTRAGLITKRTGLRGFYCSVGENQHGLNKWNFQNGFLVYESERFGEIENITESNPQNELIKYRFKITKNTKKSTLHFSTDTPVNVSAISLLVEIFSRLIYEKAGIIVDLDKVYFSTIEFNKDYCKIRIDGANCISFTNFLSHYKIYQKSHCVREEIKVTSRFNAGVLMKLLNQGVIASDFEMNLNEVKEELVKLGRNTDKNFKAIIKKLPGLKIKSGCLRREQDAQEND